MKIPAEDPVVSEVTAILHEWHKIWISLYLDNQSELFETIEVLLDKLITARAELISALKQSSSQEPGNQEQQIIEIKSDIVDKIHQGNRLLNLDLVPRDRDFKLVDPVDLCPIKLYQLHSEAASDTFSIKFNDESYGYRDHQPSITSSASSSVSQATLENVVTSTNQISNHLQLAVKGHHLIALPNNELVEAQFSIVEAVTTGSSNSNNNSSSFSHLKPMTDKFLIQIKNDELVCGVPNTIFANLAPLNNRDHDVFLHVQVYRIGRMTLVDGHKSAFGKQQSNHNLLTTNQNGSTNSIANATKLTSNGLSRNRHSTIGGYYSALPIYRRPFGTTMVPLKDCIASGKEVKLSVRVLMSNESEFAQVHELYSKKNFSSKGNQNLPTLQLDLSTKLLSCAEESLQKMSTYHPNCVTEKRGFPDVVMPGDFKNDLHLTLESAEFEKGGKSISKNIEASISLIDKAGLTIDDCISYGSNCDNVSSYKSCIFYHSNSPKWHESIKINVPLSEFDSAHIRIEFRHCSTKERDKKFLGFSFLPLSDEDGTIIPDKSHDLYLYKCDSQLWEDESLNLSKYTSLPYGPDARASTNAKQATQQSFTHSNREIVTVSTFLLSTKLTQNSHLLNLLKWRELFKRKNKDFEEALRNALTIKGDEIVKFLQDILDTLFDTFAISITTEDDHSALIFKVLIHIFLLLEEPKYQHFRPVLDTYASAHFSATLVYRGLLACIKKCLEYSTMVERHVPIQRCFRAIKYIFQFIVQSKLLYSKATGEQNDEPFLNDLRHLFRLFELMLSNSNPKILPIQVTFLESFPGTLEQLVKVVCTQELAKVAISLVGSVGFRLPPTLSRAKLIFIKKTAESNLTKNQDVRLQITENFCRHLDYYVRHSEELELCYEVLEILTVKIHDYHWPSIYRLYQLTSKSKGQDKISSTCSVITVGEISALAKESPIQANQLDLAVTNLSRELEPLINLLDPLLQLLDQLVRDFNSDRVLVQKYCTCILTVLKLMGKVSFDQFVSRKRIDYPKLCNLFRSFRAVYNRDWYVMQLASHSILEHPIDVISKTIQAGPDTQPINRQLTSYIKLITDFITHPTLQLEVFSDRKKNYVLGVFGDLRIKFIAQLIRFWNELSRANKSDLIPLSIQSFLDASLLPNSELQQKIIPVFYDMIDVEDHYKSNSRQIERCLIDNLDLFMNLDRGSSEFVENFGNILSQIIKERSPAWEQRGLKLINSFTRLMQLLVDYRKSLETSEHRGKQMNCLVELLNYYKDQDRMDLHLKYLFKLCDMHLEVGNHTEAALTLKLYTDEIKWCHKNLSPLDGYRPEEQEWRRKEALYHKIIDYFDSGKCWEETISLCKELASFYENFLVDYEKVSSTLKRLAQFLDNILKEHRPEREYFRVEFIGSDLPDYVRGKEFIYRGGEYEKLAAFMQRMISEFPGAQILNFKSKQSVNKDTSGKFIVISNVKPVPFLQEHFKTGQRNVNDKIIHYYLNNRLDTFSYDIPILRPAAKEKSGEFNAKYLWVGRHMLKTKRQLPDILPWSEVISSEYTEISPINHAIETISSMNLELTKLILSYKNEPNRQISPLTMRLQGVIEAAVNGGPSVFVNAFLKNRPEEFEHQPDQDQIIRLRNLINQQFTILETGLGLHSKLAPPDVMPLHARLVERLNTTRRSLLDDTTTIVNNENNYEALIHHDDTSVNLTNDSNSTARVLGQEAGAKDEVDSHDVNGNVYGDLDDAIYSQPLDPQITKFISSAGTKSELSSPSRCNYNTSNSSSLSTLAVLSNMPPNRSILSITPSKEITLHQSSLSSLGNNELCSRAARKLTYESYKSDGAKMPDKSRNNQEAPPLPPRSFVTDKYGTSRTMNRSPLRTNHNQSPSDSSIHWSVREPTNFNDSSTPPPIINLASLNSIEASRVLQSMNQEFPPVRIYPPSNLPRLLKVPDNSSRQHQKHCDASDPPPLPLRTRSMNNHQINHPETVQNDKVELRDRSTPSEQTVDKVQSNIAKINDSSDDSNSTN